MLALIQLIDVCSQDTPMQNSPTLGYAVLSLACVAIVLGSSSLQITTAQDTIKPAELRHRLGAAANEQIRIKYDAQVLAGVLHLPKGEGPHPAIIFIHGSGPADRTCGGYYEPLWER